MKSLLASFCLTLASVAFGFETRLGAPGAGIRTVATVDPHGASSAVVRIAVPISGIQEFWTPNLSGPFQGRKWRIANVAGPQMDMPYIAYFNTAGDNAFSIGSDTLEVDNEIVSQINQEQGVFEVELTVAAGAGRTLAPFRVTMDRRTLPWTRVLRDWREALPYEKGRYPDSAWLPVYCSWYAAHAAITQDWTERTAKIAADLGFKTFILDDGWSYDELKRVNPKTITTWYRDVGRWDSFSAAKFPDFRAHRERMRAMGLNYIVWTAPFFVGTRAPAFRRWGFDKRADKVPFEGNVLTDIENREQMASVTEQLVKLMKDTDLDGLKIDFLDYIVPSCKKPQSAEVLDYMRDLVRKIRAVKPDALIEFRQSYANPVTAGQATQFRAGDVPFEWLDNLRRIAQIRLAMGDGVPIHADPICWSANETSDNINRHFLAAMAGVPMVSMGLEEMSDSERMTVRKWLAYYRAFVEKFQRGGAWDVIYKNGGVAAVVSMRDDEVLLIVNDPDITRKLDTLVGAKKPTILNLTHETLALSCGIAVPPAAAYPSAN